MIKKNIISFANMKGGVGKTSLCANLAYTLSKYHKKKILLIDMDPQFNLSSLFIEEKELFERMKNKKNIYQIFANHFSILEDNSNEIEYLTNVYPEICLKNIKSKNLDILPGTIDLFTIPEESMVQNKLDDFIEINKLKSEYDFIFIDCPPTKGKYLTISLKASDYYIIPVKPDFLSTIGITLFEKEVESIKKDGKSIDLFSIIFTLVNENTNHHKQKMDEVKSDYITNVFDNYIKHSFKIPELASENMFIYDFNNEPLKVHKHDIMNLSDEFLNKYNLFNGRSGENELRK